MASFFDHVMSVSWITSITSYLAIATLAVVVYHYWQRTSGSDWARLGVKCPKLSPFYFFGDDFRKQLSNIINAYGDTVAIVTGTGQSIVTTNFDLMRHVFIKDFNNFVDRSDGLTSNSPFAKSLFFAKGNSWRRHRQIVSPTFTSGKLRHIAKTIEKSAQALGNYLEAAARAGTTVAIKDATGRFSCEVIAKTGFGLNVNFIGQKDPEFFNYAKSMLATNLGIRRIIIQTMILISPSLLKIFNKVFKSIQLFEPIDLDADKYFKTILDATVADRRKLQHSDRKSVDFLDLLLKANEAVKQGKLEQVDEDEPDAGSWRSGSDIKELTDDEILGHSMLVIFAGLETTATALQMCLYVLASHPDIQDRVYEEITRVVQGENPTPEELNSLTYTEMTVNETLRLYPPVPIVTRKAKDTRTYNGVTIPKGTLVQIPFFHILKDHRIWPESDQFRPERFDPEEKQKRDPLAFVCFGHGPRICLGMRLAYLELKIALVYILRRVKVILNEETEPKKGGDGVKFTPQGLLTPEQPIRLAFELRGKS
ncbi:cytochrome P450 3A41-like [Physella acuta]|uniref:cytochrome P450 3A41-like n=1 Tax=Physella acuta TaxID=109671 RepID=UPI0027DBD1A9|nr:cytochrome P450 3A41-like [Physella acuta]